MAKKLIAIDGDTGACEQVSLLSYPTTQGPDVTETLNGDGSKSYALKPYPVVVGDGVTAATDASGKITYTVSNDVCALLGGLADNGNTVGG